MEIARTLPPAPSHVMVLLWGPPQEVPDMAFSMQADVYVGLYGVAQDATADAACRDWATGHMRRLEPLSCGIQLADENLGLRSAPFLSEANKCRIDELRRRYDPDQVFFDYMGAPATSEDAQADAPPLPARAVGAADSGRCATRGPGGTQGADPGGWRSAPS
jgi:hypothetical protein